MLGWELPPHNSGGLGVACYYIAQALAKSGADIDFVVPYSADHSNIKFMKVHSAMDLPVSSIYGAYTNQIDGDPNQGPFNIRELQSAYMKYVEQLIEKVNPDIIHAHDWLTIESGMRAKEITNRPLVVHVHATEFDRSGGKYGNQLIHNIEYQGLVMADRVIAVSEFTKNMIVEQYSIPANKIEVAYNALNLEDLGSYDYDLRTYNYLESLKREGYTIVSTLTRFTAQKGLTNLLRAAAKALSKYDKLAFLLAGDGELRDELIKLSADLGISDRVFFTGFVRGKQWRDTYSVSDVFVMSSVSEPFGLTALEAAHHDNALIITRQAGVGEVLNSVFRYDFWDEDRLADQIVGIATSEALQSELKNNVQNEYARLNWGDVAQICFETYVKAKQGASA